MSSELFSPEANALCKVIMAELNAAYAACVERHVFELRRAEPEDPVAIALSALCLCLATQAIGAGSSDEHALDNLAACLAFMRDCAAKGIIEIEAKTFNEA